MIKKIFFLSAAIFFLLHISCAIAQEDSLPATKDTVKVGIYITSIYDLKLGEESFGVDFWMWTLYKNDSLKPLETAEFINAKDYTYSLPYIEKKGNINWGSQKCKATVKNPWNIENFPFDRQKIIIELEESDKDTSEMTYVADVKNSTYDKSININGWEIVDFNIEAKTHTYQTTYGDPELSGESSYPEAVITLVLERDSLGLFIKLFTGAYVAFLISLMVFFIEPVDLDPRFGLSVGGIFAAVGNKYIVDSILPESVKFTLVDIIHDLTFVYILITIALSIFSLYKFKKGKENLSRRIDRGSFFTLLITFIILNAYFIIRAIYLTN